MSCDSGDEAFDNISKKYVKLKRVSPVQAYKPVPAVLPFTDGLHLFEAAKNLISDTISSLSSPQKRKTSKRRGTNSRDTPSKRGCEWQDELEQILAYHSSLSCPPSSSCRGRKRGGKNPSASSSCCGNAVSSTKSNRGRKTSRNVSASTSTSTARANTPRRGRGRGRGSTASTSHASVGNIQNSAAVNWNSQPTQRRTTRAGQRNCVSGTQSYNNIPTYSVGNTEEYYDKLEDVPLFSSKPIENNEIIEINDSITENNVCLKKLNNDVVILDEDDENEVLSVRVEWKFLDIVKFNIRRHQKIKEIFDHFAKKENVEMDKLAFLYDDQILTMDDTPHSIGYSIAKCIEGGVLSSSLNTQMLKEPPATAVGIKIKFQCQKIKRPFETYIQKNEKLSLAMYKCAEHLELPLSSLKFEFDGDIVKGTETAQSLDIDDEACIDVKIKN